MVDIDDQSTVLSRILSRTNQYLNSRPLVPPPSPAGSPGPHIHVDLPEPPPILPALVAAGAEPEVARVMQTAYYQRACEYRERILVMISRAYSKFAQISATSPSDETIVAAFKQAYLKKLGSWINESVIFLQAKGPSVLRCRDDKGTPVKTFKTFNHQCVPLLEQVFKENQFPTHADKVLLAKESNMTYRQIHVWFQNRRNRRKKALHKKPVSEEAIIPFDPPIRKTDKLAKQDAPTSGPRMPASSFVTKVSDILGGGVAPRHAFPATYPPNCEYDPFPGVPIFPVPKWPRRPVIPSQCPRQSKINVDELAEKFSRLNVWDDFVSRSCRKAGNVTGDGFAATCAITVRPSAAPHPACLRTVAISPILPATICRPISAPAYALHAFRSPSPDSPMMTLIPQHIRRRKICPIPKRTPGPSSPLDWESSRRLNSSPSRTASTRSSSVGSNTSRCNKSDYNWSSTSSSTVTTPEPSPSPLSHPA